MSSIVNELPPSQNDSRIQTEDIEDMGRSVSAEEHASLANRTTPRQLLKSNFLSEHHNVDVEDHKGSTPGTQKIFLKTYGCSHNVSDSEYMAGILQTYGYRITPNRNDADLWLVNSCTVKDPSQAAFMHLVKSAKSIQRPIVVAGCVSQADRKLSGLENVSVVGIQNIDRVVEAVEQTLDGNVVKMLNKRGLPRLDLPKVRKNKLIEIIPLSTGCLGSCTYCKTKHARGKLGSYDPAAILERVKHVISEGVNEIWLSSEDTGAYGRDIGTNIVKLLWSIIEVLPEEGVMLRIGMTNPPYIMEHLEKIAIILKHPKVFSFLHVPLQSSCNAVLNSMNREYTVEEFNHIANYLLKEVPGMTFATDIICGFPTETEEYFQETMQSMDHYKFPVVNISQFYPRPGTPAAKMKRIATQIVKERSRKLTTLFEGFNPYARLVGKTLKVLFSEELSEDGAHSVAHSKAYVKVLVPYEDDLVGREAYVSIEKCDRFHIVGKLVDKPLYMDESKGESIQEITNSDEIGGCFVQNIKSHGRNVSIAAAALLSIAAISVVRSMSNNR